MTAWTDRHRTKGLEHSLKKKAHVDESEIDHTSSVREIETAICDTVGHGYNETAICLIADDSWKDSDYWMCREEDNPGRL